MCKYNYVVLPSGCNHPTLTIIFLGKASVLLRCGTLQSTSLECSKSTSNTGIKGTQRIRVFQLLCWHSLQSILMLMGMQISVYSASSVYKLHRANCIRITLSAEMKAIILIKDALIKDCTRMLGSANFTFHSCQSQAIKPQSSSGLRSHLGTDTRTTILLLNPRFWKLSTKAKLMLKLQHYQLDLVYTQLFLLHSEQACSQETLLLKILPQG